MVNYDLYCFVVLSYPIHSQYFDTNSFASEKSALEFVKENCHNWVGFTLFKVDFATNNLREVVENDF